MIEEFCEITSGWSSFTRYNKKQDILRRNDWKLVSQRGSDIVIIQLYRKEMNCQNHEYTKEKGMHNLYKCDNCNTLRFGNQLRNYIHLDDGWF